MKSIYGEEDIQRLHRHSQVLAAIYAWGEKGLFEKLAQQGPLTLEELPGDLRALEITAVILSHAGLLVGDRNLWGLSQRAKSLWEEGALDYFRGMEFFADLAQVGDLLEEGGPLASRKDSEGGVNRKDKEKSRRFLNRLYRRSAESARETVEWMGKYLSEGDSVLDLGGGHGRYARDLADRGYRATLFDFPICIELARERHKEAIEYREGDFFEDDLGGPYDAVLMSNIIHSHSPQKNRDLLAKVYGALHPGSLVVIKDMFVDDCGCHPERSAVFGLTMLCYSQGGRSYTFGEVEKWLRTAGFSPFGEIHLTSFSLLLGRR